MTDDLRARIAEALREDLQRAIPPVELFPGMPINGGMGRAVYDLADAVLAVVQPELEQLRDGSFLYRKNAELHERAEQAEAALERVRELHCSDSIPDGAGVPHCEDDMEPMPCSTLAALNGAPRTGEAGQ